MSVFPAFPVQVVFELINISKTFVEMFADNNMKAGKLHNICLQISVIQWC